MQGYDEWQIRYLLGFVLVGLTLRNCLYTFFLTWLNLISRMTAVVVVAAAAAAAVSIVDPWLPGQ